MGTRPPGVTAATLFPSRVILPTTRVRPRFTEPRSCGNVGRGVGPAGTPFRSVSSDLHSPSGGSGVVRIGRKRRHRRARALGHARPRRAVETSNPAKRRRPNAGSGFVSRRAPRTRTAGGRRTLPGARRVDSAANGGSDGDRRGRGWTVEENRGFGFAVPDGERLSRRVPRGLLVVDVV